MRGTYPSASPSSDCPSVGSAWAMYQTRPRKRWIPSIPVGFLATALLVVNNLRDIPGDTVAGKRTLAVRIGDMNTRWLYTGLLVATFVAVPLVAGLGGRPAGALALVAVVLAQRPVTAVLGGARGPALIPVLGATGRVQLVFGLLFALGLAISG